LSVPGAFQALISCSFFTNKLTVSEIKQKLVRVDTANGGYDLLNQGETNISEYVDTVSIKSRDIQGFRTKGIWYFDKRQGELRYSLLAIAPVAQDVQTMGREDVGDDELLSLFWVFYPDARQVLHDMKVFNEKSSSYPISFDNILNARTLNIILSINCDKIVDALFLNQRLVFLFFK